VIIPRRPKIREGAKIRGSMDELDQIMIKKDFD